MTLKSTLNIATLALVFAFFFASCAPNDAKLTRNVQAGVVVLDSNIRVDVKEGVVTLSGMVMDESTRNAAESAVREIKGVKSVINNTTVKEVLTGEVPGPDERLQKAIDSSFNSQKINGIQATVQDGEVTLSGDAKKAEVLRIMKAVNESRPKRVVNRLKVE